MKWERQSDFQNNSSERLLSGIEYQMQKKNILGPSHPSFPKRAIKKGKNRIDYFRHSLTNSVVFEERNENSNLISSQNIQFPNSKKETSNDNTHRIHSNKGSKRVTQQSCLQKQSHQSKENFPSKKDSDNNLLNSSKNVSLKVLNDHSSQPILLGIKSFHPQQQKLQKEQKKYYNTSINSINQRQVQDAGNLGQKQIIKQSKAYFSSFCNRTAQDLFRELNRKMQQEKEISNTKNKNKNCFYFNLKNKLKKQINRISQDKSRDQYKLLIHGCEENKHQRIHSNRNVVTDRVRPQTAKSLTSSKLLNSSTSNKLKRPNSCQTSPDEIDYYKKLIYTRPQSPKNSFKRQRNTTKEKQTERKYINNRLLTSDGHQKDQKNKRQKTQANICKQQNDRLISILNQCNNYENIYSPLNNDMKTFEYYCKKIDVGMEKASNLLVDIQDNDSFED